MKYIKKFENNTITWEEYLEIWKDILPEKYILYKANSDKYFILEISFEELEDLKNNWNRYSLLQSLIYLPTKKLWTYSKNMNYFKKNKNQHFFMNVREITNIIYQSNDLKDVKEICHTLPGQAKFNI